MGCNLGKGTLGLQLCLQQCSSEVDTNSDPNPAIICFCVTHKLRMAFIFLNG